MSLGGNANAHWKGIEARWELGPGRRGEPVPSVCVFSGPQCIVGAQWIVWECRVFLLSSEKPTWLNPGQCGCPPATKSQRNWPA